MPKAAPKAQPIRLNIKGMNYAPENELGVVFLFAHLAPRFGFKGVERIQAAFPDCVARRRTGQGEKHVRIEFEYRSSSFRKHRHSAKDCDCIVCWKHDWPDAPPELEIIELRSKVDLGFDVWICALTPDYGDDLESERSVTHWSVPSLAKVGDLILFYRTSPDMKIVDIFRVNSPVRRDKTWKYMADIKRVTRLKSPVHLEHLRQRRTLRDASFMRANMQGRPNVTAHWPSLLDLIIDLNRSLRTRLTKYQPRI